MVQFFVVEEEKMANVMAIYGLFVGQCAGLSRCWHWDYAEKK